MVGGVVVGQMGTFKLKAGMALLRGEVDQILVGGKFNGVRPIWGRGQI